MIDGRPRGTPANCAVPGSTSFRRLHEFFRQRGKLVCAFYFTPVPYDQDTHAFLHELRCNGYSVVVKREWGAEGLRHRTNVNVDLAVRSFMMADTVDHIVIFSGDDNLRRLVEALKKRRTRVSVISTLKTSPPILADRLRRQADQFVELAELAPAIGLPCSGGEDERSVVAGLVE
jgi:uncharacterized LabA/DUF88 family protein